MKNLNVRAKILIPVLFLTFCAFLSGIVGSLSSKQIMSSTTAIVNDYSATIQNLNDIQTNYESIRRVVFAHCVADDKPSMSALEEELQSLRDSNSALIEAVYNSMNEEAELESFNEFLEAYTEFIELTEQAIEYSSRNKDDEAAELANNDLTTLGTELSNEINEIIQENKSDMAEAVASEEAMYNTSNSISFVSMLLTIGATIFAIIVSIREIARPIAQTNQKLTTIISNIESGNGDLTERVPVRGKDEIGQLGMGINGFIEGLQGIMVNITDNSNRLEHIVGTVSSSVSTANENSVDISSVMEELSASMQEIASTVTNVNCHTMDVESNVVELAQTSTDLLAYADDMKTRATDLETTAVTNKQNANDVINDILVALKKAVEDSKSVDRVNDLTNEILNISSQTNLLALNASIEAARAGEAGKGFAVVAEEIRQLADSSREAANNIQAINNMVIQAVKQLISSSDTIIDYINESVLPDYDNFVAVGKQYSDDASHVNEIITQFNTMSTEVRELTKAISEAINGISQAVEESASGVSTAALNTSDLVKDIDQISLEMRNNSEVAGTLKAETDKFVNL
jgi:methyl-accepting chemotaxis protein